MLKFFLDTVDRGSNKCCNKDKTKYIHKYQISSTRKTSTSTLAIYNKYILLPFRSSTPPPRCPLAASTQPPRHPHADPTPPPLCRNAATLSLLAASTPPPRLPTPP